MVPATMLPDNYHHECVGRCVKTTNHTTLWKTINLDAFAVVRSLKSSIREVRALRCSQPSAARRCMCIGAETI